MDPVDLFRQDGVTAYSHDVQVDDAGIAWVSGDGGTRGYWTEGRHYDPLKGRDPARRRRSKPIPYAGGGLATAAARRDGGSSTTPWRPVGRSAPAADSATAGASCCSATEEDFGPAADGCTERGKFTIASLKGSYNGEAWRSTPESPFRLKTVGTWSPYEQEGSVGDPPPLGTSARRTTSTSTAAP